MKQADPQVNELPASTKSTLLFKWRQENPDAQQCNIHYDPSYNQITRWSFQKQENVIHNQKKTN
jgi:hypothetical protein